MTMHPQPVVRGVLKDVPAAVAIPIGLTSAEARRRLGELGPNAVAEHARSRWRVFLAKFWSPVPWRLRSLCSWGSASMSKQR